MTRGGNIALVILFFGIGIVIGIASTSMISERPVKEPKPKCERETKIYILDTELGFIVERRLTKKNCKIIKGYLRTKYPNSRPGGTFYSNITDATKYKNLKVAELCLYHAGYREYSLKKLQLLQRKTE